MNRMWRRILQAIREADKRDWPYVYGVVLIFTLFVAGSLTYEPSPPPTITNPIALKAKADLNWEMAEMERVLDGKYREVRNSWSMSTFRIVSVRFTSELSYKEVVAHYGRQLEQRGWVYDAVKYYKSGDSGLMYPIAIYIKGTYNAKVAIRDGYYYLVFEWRRTGIVSSVLL